MAVKASAHSEPRGALCSIGSVVNRQRHNPLARPCSSSCTLVAWFLLAEADDKQKVYTIRAYDIE